MNTDNLIGREHLGGYIASDEVNPHGDPCTYVPGVWDLLLAAVRPATFLDVGCGEGHAVKYFHDAGVRALGIEGCLEAWKPGIVPARLLIHHDYTTGPAASPLLAGSFDLVWSCEFVEHVEERFAENFLHTFDRGKVIAMTHAFPGQGGYHHVNEQPSDYWIARLERRGFHLARPLTRQSRLLDQHGHWGRSGLIFVKERQGGKKGGFLHRDAPVRPPLRPAPPVFRPFPSR